MDSLWWAVMVPRSLVTAARLTPQARYLYMSMCSACRAGESSLALRLQELAELTGFCAHSTLQRYISELMGEQWLSQEKRSRQPSRYTLLTPAGNPGRAPKIKVPRSLIRHRALSPTAKCLYVMMLARRPESPVGIAHQSGVTFGTEKTLRSHFNSLVRAGWVQRVRPSNARGYAYAPLDPHLRRREAALEIVQDRLHKAKHTGEALMKELLNILVPDRRFQDNARPGFLVNPFTLQRLELDRWYTAAMVAVEFNGPQHYRATPLYASLAEVQQQQGRDLIKAALTERYGIRLVTVLGPELTFGRLREKLRHYMPLRELSPDDPVVRFLDKFSRAYVRRAQRHPTHSDAAKW